VPLQTLSGYLKELSRMVVVEMMPGENDPAGATIPQQGVPVGMFGMRREEVDEQGEYINASESGGERAMGGGFRSLTNPAWIGVSDTLLLGTSGQPLDDIFKYLESEDRMGMAKATLCDWRHMAPTAPDTLWCHPYFDTDPFIITQRPDIYFIGNQPSFQTALISSSSKTTSKSKSTTASTKSPSDEEKEKERKTRIILLPRFSKTGEVVLVNTKSLDVRVVKVEFDGMGFDL
jgi:DNA polymerase delta subunit 2